MGLNDGQLILDSPTGAYYSGQLVKGRILFQLNNVTKIRGIYLSVKGYCKVHWTSERSRRVDDRTEHYTVDHDSYQDYVSLKVYLFGNQHAEHLLQAGKHEFPFSFQLPDNCPSSFEGTRGHVRYELKVVMDIPYAIDEEKSQLLKVHAPLDLNKLNCKEPICMEFLQAFCCWCVNSGSAETIVKIPVSGFCPGQTIPIEIGCRNRSSVEIDRINFIITKETKYHAEREASTKEEEALILKEGKGPVAPHTDRNWQLDLRVPDLDIYNMQDCSFIDISYKLKVNISTSGCHTDENDTCPLTFGTIPLVGYQDNIPNPLQDQLPQITNTYPSVNAPYPPPITNQPVLHYPNSPYPPNPYPNSPYSTPSPYPGNSPYPLPTPYPTSDPNNMPQVSPRPPYPTPQSNLVPFPSSQQNLTPYPPQEVNNISQKSPPYPTSPANVGPYLPSPNITSPYPPSLPARAAQTGLKTGNLGFVVGHKDPSTMPLLPAGAVPYPINQGSRPVSPYAASAPPTDENTDDTTLLRSSSPYNPAFMNDSKKDEN